MPDLDSRLSVEEYVEILRELGGEATTREIADKADRDISTVTAVLGAAVRNGEVENVERERVWGEGSPYRYEVAEDARDDDSGEQEGGEG